MYPKLYIWSILYNKKELILATCFDSGLLRVWFLERDQEQVLAGAVLAESVCQPVYRLLSVYNFERYHGSDVWLKSISD